MQPRGESEKTSFPRFHLLKNTLLSARYLHLPQLNLHPATVCFLSHALLIIPRTRCLPINHELHPNLPKKKKEIKPFFYCLRAIYGIFMESDCRWCSTWYELLHKNRLCRCCYRYDCHIPYHSRLFVFIFRTNYACQMIVYIFFQNSF